MPIENRVWSIRFIDYDKEWIQPWGNKLRFEITSPEHQTIFTTVYFTTEFINDYFHIPGNRNRWLERRQEIKKNKLELFKKWALMRIEEALRKNTTVDTLKILSTDFEWAKKIEKGHLKPSSQRQNDNIYVYNVERKIGF